MWAKALDRAGWALWLALIGLLPLTSLPLMRLFFGSAMVAPPSSLPLLGLALLYLVPTLLQGGRLPSQSKPLLAFCAIALLASLLSYAIPFPIFLQNERLRGMLEAALTLGVGVAAYLVSATWAAGESRLSVTLRWINWSGLVMLAWSMAQGVATLAFNYYPPWMEAIQRLLSSGPVYDLRATGFAIEPSWLAHQLNMLYLPLWLAASVRRASAHRWRIVGLSFENLLLLGGFSVLWLTVSRVGLAAFFLTAAYLLLRANWSLIGWVQNRLLPRLRLAERLGLARRSDAEEERWLRLARPLLRFELILLLVVAYGGVLFGSAQLLSRIDPRMKRLFDFSTLAQSGFLEYANQLVFAERIVYWQVGWEVFNDHPWLGVGLNNAGYFFPEKVSSYGWLLPDINRAVFRSTNIPNTKSLWSRLLAETGLLGFGAFLTWLWLLFLTGRALDRARFALGQVVGLAAQLVVVAILLEGFSVDTFALPYFWLTFGLATAAWKIDRGERTISKFPSFA